MFMLQPKYNNKDNVIWMGFDSIEINLVLNYFSKRSAITLDPEIKAR